MAILRHRLFKVWRDYFGFELVYDDYDLFMDVLAVKGRQFLLAQMPHAVMVRYFFNATFFRLALTAEGWYSLAAASK